MPATFGIAAVSIAGKARSDPARFSLKFIRPLVVSVVSVLSVVDFQFSESIIYCPPL